MKSSWNISTQPFFRGLSEPAIDFFQRHATFVHAKSGEVIFQQGDPADALYLIVSGSIAIQKTLDSNPLAEVHHLQILTSGQFFGETILFDLTTRSATLVAREDVQLLKITAQHMAIFADCFPADYAYLLKQSGATLHQRLLTMNNQTIKYLENNAVKMGNFFIHIIVVICIFAFLLKLFSAFHLRYVVDFSMFGFLLIAGVVPLGVLIYRKTHAREDFGLTFFQAAAHIKESIVYTLPILVGLLFAKYVAMHFFHFELFEGVLFFSPERLSIEKKGVLLVLYILSCPLQEFISRGMLQGLLRKFLLGKYKTLQSILISNLIYATVHLYLSISYALAVFIPGLFWGYLYAKQKTLVGVSVSHILVGVWAIYFLGVRGILVYPT